MPESMAAVHAAGVDAIIHRASIGMNSDDGYVARRTAALAEGMLWGAYHFLTKYGDPHVQADFFIASAQPDAKTLIAVDVERNVDNTIPDLITLEAFVIQIHNKLNRWPVLYTGFYVLKDDLHWNGASYQGVLNNCPLWIAAYGDSPIIPVGWSNYTLWQYTNGSIGPEPHRFPGLQNAYDREQFNGTLAELTAWWGT